MPIGIAGIDVRSGFYKDAKATIILELLPAGPSQGACSSIRVSPIRKESPHGIEISSSDSPVEGTPAVAIERIYVSNGICQFCLKIIVP